MMVNGVAERDAYRHLVVEARLPGIGGEGARRAIRLLKNALGAGERG
jgi:hypothetical protein